MDRSETGAGVTGLVWAVPASLIVAAALGVFDNAIGKGADAVVLATAAAAVGFIAWSAWPLWVRLSWTVPFGLTAALVLVAVPPPALFLLGSLLGVLLALMVLSPRAANLWASRILGLRPYGRLDERELAYARLLADAESKLARAAGHAGDGRSPADALGRTRDAIAGAAASAVPADEWQAPRRELLALADAVALAIGSSAADRPQAQAAATAQQLRFRDALDRAWSARVRPWRGLELG